jgi:hypothetical protein
MENIVPAVAAPSTKVRRREEVSGGEDIWGERDMPTFGPPTPIAIVPHARAKEKRAEGSRRGERDAYVRATYNHHCLSLRQSQGKQSGGESQRVESLKPWMGSGEGRETSESKEGEWERWERRIRMRTWLIKGVNTCWIKNSSPKTRDQCRLLIQPDSVNYFIIADCFKIRQEYSFFLQTSRGICICVGFFQFQQWWPVGTMVYV